MVLAAPNGNLSEFPRSLARCRSKRFLKVIRSARARAWRFGKALLNATVLVRAASLQVEAGVVVARSHSDPSM